MHRTRVIGGVFALTLVLMAGLSLTVQASAVVSMAPVSQTAAAPQDNSLPAVQQPPQPTQVPPAAVTAKPEVAAEENASESWTPTFAKAFNLLILLGALTYFLRTPIATYLQTRSDQIRKDLIDAASLRKEGEARLATVRAQLAALPAELAQLKQMGKDELAAEHVRMKEATTRERQQMIDRTHREIDVQFRVARRALLDHVAQLSMDLARTRVIREITPADQDRLVDQYAGEVR